jgi:hypothetical protein
MNRGNETSVGLSNQVSMPGGMTALELVPAEASVPGPPHRRANHRLRRARSTVVGAIASLIVLNAGLAVVVNLRPGIRDPLFDLPAERFRQRFAGDHDRPITIAFLGSSRTGGGIRPAVVENMVTAETGRPCVAYNLHVPGNGPVGELVHWRRLVDRGSRPDVVVVEITPARFASIEGVPDEAILLHGDRLTRPELRLVRGYGFKAEVIDEYREANLNPWFGFRFQMVGIAMQRWLPPGVVRHEQRAAVDQGWQQPFFVQRNADHFQAAIEQNRPLLFKPMQEAVFNGPPAAALREIVRSAKTAGSAVAVWVTPEGSPFRAWYPERVNQELAAFLNELRSAGAIVADGRTWLPDEAFSDGHHPVRTWADEYTRKVTRGVVLPAVPK